MPNFFDWLAEKLRVPMMALALFSLPVFLFSYGLMIVDFVTTRPLWLSAAAVFAHFMVWLGAASFRDYQQQRHTTKGETQGAARPLP